jgi:ABC-2 type transport system ATP-binding protein
LASHLLDEVEKVCTHVLILQKGVGLYSGSVDTLISSEGYFEIQAKDADQLVKLLQEIEAVGEIKQTRSHFQAYLKSPLEVDELQNYLIENKCTVTHLVKRKERLEEQFLELTKNQNL